MDREELIARIEALRPEFEKVFLQFGAHEPDWEPLEQTLLGDFMFMGYTDGIRLYKHSFTRRYLNLDEKGRAYRYLGENRGYEQIPLEEGIAHAFEDAEELVGWVRDRSDPPPPSRGDEGDVY
jgi:hypothetical protein